MELLPPQKNPLAMATPLRAERTSQRCASYKYFAPNGAILKTSNTGPTAGVEDSQFERDCLPGAWAPASYDTPDRNTSLAPVQSRKSWS